MGWKFWMKHQWSCKLSRRCFNVVVTVWIICVARVILILFIRFFEWMERTTKWLIKSGFMWENHFEMKFGIEYNVICSMWSVARVIFTIIRLRVLCSLQVLLYVVPSRLPLNKNGLLWLCNGHFHRLWKLSSIRSHMTRWCVVHSEAMPTWLETDREL